MSVFKVKDNNDQWITVSTGGVGVPAGGSTAQVLVKASNADYSTRWSEQVHVGGNPPTDEGVAIWLDTDEAGMSAVSSVNAKTGTVVLDADDVGAMAEWELLWENASPTSEFAAQTVPLDLSGYDALYLLYLADKSDVGMLSSAILLVGKTGRIEATRYQALRRTANVSSTGVVFDNNYYLISYATTNTAIYNSGCIPYRIYGIKGVITT